MVCRRVALAFLLVAGLAQATEYYVSPTGNDSSAGSISQPWRTLHKALRSVKGGDTVSFRAGTYASAHAPWDLHPAAGKWITFKPHQNEKVIINTAGGAWSFHGASYVVIEGFEITDLAYRHDIPHSCNLLTSASCVDFVRGLGHGGSGLTFNSTFFGNARTHSHHIIIRNNEVHHNTVYGMTGAGQGSYEFQILNNHVHHNGYAGLREGYGAYFEGTNWVVRGNHFHHNSGNNLRIGNISATHHAVGWIVEGNVLHSAEGPFLHSSGNVRDDSLNIALYGSEGSIVRNNLLYGSYGSGMWAVNVNSAKPDLVYNNVFYGNGLGGLRVSGGPVMARNNIAWGNGTRLPAYQLELTSTHSGLAENNLVGGGNQLIRNTGSGIERNNLRNLAPRFVNPAAGDFHLQAGSGAIDRGMRLVEVRYDFDGRARPLDSSIDIGPFEFGATTRRTPKSPTSLVVR